jgi:flavin reductase (DIM6/NTAB) family NADH-FMN oxidoreductase RutF
MEIQPESLEPRDRYKLLIGSIVPRPIAFVSTISSDGAHNLAPYSFFAGVGSNPMTLLFCPATKADGTDKDTLRNCLPSEEGGVGQFVVNLATESYALKVAAAAEMLPYGESEFDFTGLNPVPSSQVRPPRLAESPVSFECETLQVVRTAPGEPASGNIVIGRVLNIHIDEALINERFHVDADRLEAIGRMGGLEYCKTRDRFAMPRGRQALQQAEKAG